MSPRRPLLPVMWSRLMPPVARRWSRRVGFVLLNLWLVYHLAAIVLAPWSVPPASWLVRNSWRAVGAYDQALFLNHGYHYFAPEPGNSTLVGYVLEMPDGSLQTGRIPNRQIHPRLFYHRHFMLTEALASDDWSPEVRSELVRAMASELCHEHGAHRVTLSRVGHRLPTMEDVRKGVRLDDPVSYSEEPLGRFVYDDRTQTVQLETNNAMEAEQVDPSQPPDSPPTTAPRPIVTGPAAPLELVPTPDRTR